ncbi:MAG: hypothetical protein ACO1OB_32355 [Archangium sp.]
MFAVNKLNSDFALKNTGVSNAIQSEHLPRHRWYTIKEAFSPILVETAIRDADCKTGDLVYDPFCGSGTVPLAALELGAGLRAAATEVNPFLAFVANAKQQQFGARAWKAATDRVLLSRPEKSPLEGFSTFSKTRSNQKWLFETSVLRAFRGSWEATSAMTTGIRRVTRLCLLGAAMDVCNAVRDGKCLRYKPSRLAAKFSAEDFRAAFSARAQMVAEDVVCADLRGESAPIHLADSRSSSATNDGPISLTVTSPPYLNSFDYSDVYRPELFLGGFVDTNESLMTVRLKTLRSHVQANWQLAQTRNFGPQFLKAISDLELRRESLWSSKIIPMVHAYFEDIEKILLAIHHNTVVSGSLWLVVSTSAYAGVEIPVDLIIADIAENIGWSVREVGLLRDLRAAGQHWGKWTGADGDRPSLRESVVILDRTQRASKTVFPRVQ